MWHVYNVKQQFFVPVVAQTDAGYYLDVEPVSCVRIDDKSGLVAALELAVGRGNPTVATPARGAFPKSVVLRPAGFKTWAAFDRVALCWVIEEGVDGYLVSLVGSASGHVISDGSLAALCVQRDGGMFGVADAILGGLSSLRRGENPDRR